jgi:hypothetical protein
MAAPKKTSAAAMKKTGKGRKIPSAGQGSTKSAIADVLTVLDQAASVDDGYKSAVLEVVRTQPKTPRSPWK